MIYIICTYIIKAVRLASTEPIVIIFRDTNISTLHLISSQSVSSLVTFLLYNRGEFHIVQDHRHDMSRRHGDWEVVFACSLQHCKNFQNLFIRVPHLTLILMESHFYGFLFYDLKEFVKRIFANQRVIRKYLRIRIEKLYFVLNDKGWKHILKITASGTCETFYDVSRDVKSKSVLSNH